MTKLRLLSTALAVLIAAAAAAAQGVTKKVLFIGNSYTYVNDLPAMIAACAASTGDSLESDSNTPGSFSLGNHALNTVTISKIGQGGWNYVVLQGQSYELATETPEAYPFPYARMLDSMINLSSPCGETIFYMTWGRKNGDASSCPTVPFLCTYQSMDSIIHANYMRMADTNNPVVSPVGAVWHYIRDNYPSIELYQSDESHPSVAGTYAAACCFYAAIYRHNPANITYNPGLSATDAANIRQSARLVVYDSLLKWNIGRYDGVVSPACAATQIAVDPSFAHLTLSPNPATDIITITTGSNIPVPIRIYNQMGKLLLETVISNSKDISTTNFPAGMYLLHTSDLIPQTYKFVKR